MNRLLALFALVPLLFGEGLFPLETVKIEGSTVSRPAVLEAAGLAIGAPLDKARIDEACRKLQASGLFEAIDYRFAPAPKGGIALTLSLSDPRQLTAASIDVPGLQDAETWAWLKTQYPDFDRKIPGSQGAQEYLAAAIEKHLGTQLRGQHLVSRMETNFVTKRLLISFQPEVLPRVVSLAFQGQQEIPAEQLRSALAKIAQSEGYTDRGFRELVELNVRPLYEDHGMYRVKFPAIAMVYVDGGGVAVTTSIEEGSKYKLGAVTVTGDPPAAGELLQAGAFKKDEIANWTEIQKGIYAFDRPLNRRGYIIAKVSAQRLFDDEQHVLNLNVIVAKGPLYRFGTVHFKGLTPDAETKARSLWTMNAGDAFDSFYPNQFVAELGQKVDLRHFPKRTIKNQAAAGDHIMDVMIAFE